MEAVAVGLITAAVTLVGIFVRDRKQTALMQAEIVHMRADTKKEISRVREDIVELSGHVEKHNRVVERVFVLEQQPKACEERFKTLFNDMERIKR